jgi:MFS-type transporter involved in bile tolerance (Atg22 family)
VGTVGGMVNFSGQVTVIGAPIITGSIAQSTHSFAAAFATATGILLVGICGYDFLLGRIKPIPERALQPLMPT